MAEEGGADHWEHGEHELRPEGDEDELPVSDPDGPQPGAGADFAHNRHDGELGAEQLLHAVPERDPQHHGR